jgi:hypothetical protein
MSDSSDDTGGADGNGASVARGGQNTNTLSPTVSTSYFEIALLVIPADPGTQDSVDYPPAGGTLLLESDHGYSQSQSISAGTCNNDGCCSFRFADLDDHQQDLFTATVQNGDDSQIVFKGRRIFSFIEKARNENPYEPAFCEPKPDPDPIDDSPAQVPDNGPPTDDPPLGLTGAADRALPPDLSS